MLLICPSVKHLFSVINCFSGNETFSFTPKKTQGRCCPMVQGDWKAQIERVNSKVVLLFGCKLTKVEKLKGIVDALLTVVGIWHARCNGE